MTRNTRHTLLLLLTLATLPCWAATESPADGLRRCAAESDAGQRLACFDALAGSLPKLEADRFGMNANVAQQRDPTALQRAKSETLTAKITALRQSSAGEWIFTLDNQQVWAQAEQKQSMRFAVGETIRIEHGAMSSLWLAADHGRKTRVKRIA
jgi:hypothetical protein